MNKADIISMLKQAWTTALMDEADLREDMAESYASWVQGLMKAAAPELSGQAQQQQQQQQPQGGAPQGGQPPAAGGGGMQAAPEGGM